MESISKKAGFLEGLMAAIKLDDDKPETQLIKGMVALMCDMADHVDALDDMMSELNDYVESIDDDLCELESAGEDDDDDFDISFDDSDKNLTLIKNGGEKQLKLMLIPARCPKCSGVFLIDGEITNKYICPLCQKPVKPNRLTEKNTPVADLAEEGK